MDRYLFYTRSAYYGILASLPLLGLYELLVLVTHTGPVELRNAADVLLRTVLAAFGLTTTQAFLAMILLLILAIPVVRDKRVRVVPSYFAMLAGEALVYSLALGFVINLLLQPLLFPLTRGLGETAATIAWSLPGLMAEPLLALPPQAGFLHIVGQSIGAGLFEEFLFRVILLNALLLVCRIVFAEWLSAVIAILGASFLFSLAHYIGPMGDPPDLFSFLFRWMAGLLFTIIYYLRGFAVTAYTHALYDIRVLLFVLP